MALVSAEQRAVDALRAYLLRVLPAKVTETNAARAPVLKSPQAQPYVVPANAVLKARATAAGALQNIALTAGGARTAAQIAADVNAVLVGTGSADAQGRFALTGAAPVAGTPGVVEVGADTTGANAALGFDLGGELLVREALVAPVTKGIVDGETAVVDLGNGFGIVIGDRSATDTNRNIRYDERDVVMKLDVYVAVQGANAFLAQEGLEAVVTAVRSAVFDDRTLDGAVQLTLVEKTMLLGKVFRFANAGGVSPLLANAQMQVKCRVFERAP